MSKLRFCKYCGEQIKTDAQFCPSCGGDLSSEQVATEIMENPPKVAFGASTKQPVVPTPTSVEQTSKKAEAQYADLGDRIIAYIIDSIIIGLISQVILWAIPGYSPGLTIWGTTTIFTMILEFLYFFISEMLNNGQGKTLGKQIMDLQTVDATSHGSITIQQAAIHSLGKISRLLLIDLIVGFIAIDEDDRGQETRITQKLANTAVMKVKKE